jgi:hypothetical protein
MNIAILILLGYGYTIGLVLLFGCGKRLTGAEKYFC